jgi:hypothetical protein
MGIYLVEEVMDYAPASLKPMEWKGLIVLARDANDNSRLVFHGVNDAEILHRVGVSKSRWDSIRGGLLAAGVLEYQRRPDGSEMRGNAGGVAKFRIPDLKNHPDARKPAENRQPSNKPAGNRHASSGERVPETGSHLDGMVAGIQGERLPETGTPTPLSSSNPLLPPVAEVPEQCAVDPAGREGGASGNNKDHTPELLALAEALASEPRLALGEREMQMLTPIVAPWLERTTVTHMRTALTQGLPKQVANPAGLVRKRLLGKLPPPATQKASSGERCSHCSRVRAVATVHEGHRYCPDCAPQCTGCGYRLPEALLLDNLCGECRKP